MDGGGGEVTFDGVEGLPGGSGGNWRILLIIWYTPNVENGWYHIICQNGGGGSNDHANLANQGGDGGVGTSSYSDMQQTQVICRWNKYVLYDFTWRFMVVGSGADHFANNTGTLAQVASGGSHTASSGAGNDYVKFQI